MPKTLLFREMCRSTTINLDWKSEARIMIKDSQVAKEEARENQMTRS